MTEVKVIQDISCWDIITSISTVITAIATLLMLGVAFFQLKNLLKNNSLKTVLDIETEIHKRKMVLDEISSNIRLLVINSELEKAKIYQDELSGAEESYLNALDRLCFCILKGFVDEDEWKQEYIDQIKETVRYYESKLGIATYYKNIVKIYRRWSE